MTVKRLTERTALAGLTVGGTPEAPLVEGVLLCGPVSANRRRYLREAFAGDRVKKYDGVPVKVTDKHGQATGLYAEQIGTVVNARHRADGMPVGDIAVNPEKELGRAFLWDAKHQPRACSISHVAQCDTRPGKDGWDEVTELVEAVSVDVIGANGAATTKALNESVGDGSSNQSGQKGAMEFYDAWDRPSRHGKSGSGKKSKGAKGKKGKKKKESRTYYVRPAVSFSRRQLIEHLARHPAATTDLVLKAKWLAEMDGDPGLDMAAAGAPPGADAPPASTLDDAFVQAAVDEMRDCMASQGDPAKIKKCLGKLKKMLNAHADITADDDAGDESDTDDAGDDEGDDDSDTGADMTTKESKRRPDPSLVLKECSAAGYDAKPGELAVLFEIGDAGKRAIFIQEQRQKLADGKAQKPQSGGRYAPVAESKAVAPAADVKGFLDRVMR